MKKLTLLFCGLLFCVLLATPVGATITKEYEEEIYHDSSKDFAFKVRLVIETEADGTWKTDSSYELDFILIVTYFNNTHFQGDPLNFSAREGYEGKFVWIAEDITYHVLEWAPYRLINSPTTEKMANIRFYPRSEGRVKVYPVLTFRDVESHEGYFYSSFWGGHDVEPVYIDVKSPTTPLPSSELIFVVAGIVLSAVVVGTFFIVKRRKEKFNPSKR